MKDEKKLRDFVDNLMKSTMNNEREWRKVSEAELGFDLERYIASPQTYSKLKGVYENTNNYGGIAVIGKMERRQEDDEHNTYEDVYFITIKLDQLEDPITIADEDFIGVGLQVALGKLHRIITIQQVTSDQRLDNWFK